jgi:uncharacterized membrane protein
VSDQEEAGGEVEARSTGRIGEPRLPMALAVVAIAALSFAVPEEFRIAQTTEWGYPALLMVLLGLLVIGDPGRIDREKRWLRVVTAILIYDIIAGTALSSVRLVVGLTSSDAHNKVNELSAAQLLEVGALILITNILGFALLFWHHDAGGPAARAHHRPEPRRAFVWQEQSLPELEGTGWFPQFIDYLALSFNTCTAFSPTDVSPVKRWAKLVMLAESSMSLTLVVLVIARAINAL